MANRFTLQTLCCTYSHCLILWPEGWVFVSWRNGLQKLVQLAVILVLAPSLALLHGLWARSRLSITIAVNRSIQASCASFIPTSTVASAEKIHQMNCASISSREKICRSLLKNQRMKWQFRRKKCQKQRKQNRKETLVRTSRCRTIYIGFFFQRRIFPDLLAIRREA